MGARCSFTACPMQISSDYHANLNWRAHLQGLMCTG